MHRALSTALTGLGLTVASTFALSLGLSLHQQRIGFALGVLLLVLGIVLFLRGRRDSVGHRLDSLMRDGKKLLHELLAPAQAEETAPGSWGLSFGEAPAAWWDKADAFDQRVKCLLDEHPALHSEYEKGFNRRRHEQHAWDDEPEPQADKRSNAEKVLDFATATQRTPAMLVEASLEGLAEARRFIYLTQG